MKSVLDTQISIFKDYGTTSNPATINMLQWLKSEKYKKKICQIRAVADKTERDKIKQEIKKKLPGITPSGTFSYRRTDCLIRHSGLIQFDIDLTGNEDITNYHDLKNQLCNLDYVAYCGLSASATGYWGLIPIAYPEQHKEHFDALEKDFAMWGICLDTKTKSVCSLRGYSWDNDAYFNHSAVVYEKTFTPPKPQPAARQQSYNESNIPDNPFEASERILQRQGIIYQPGNRHNYLWQFARLCNRYGVSRQDCRAYVDTVYGYDEKTNWIDSYRRYGSEAEMHCQNGHSTSLQNLQKQADKVHTFTNCYGDVCTNVVDERGYPVSWDG